MSMMKQISDAVYLLVGVRNDLYTSECFQYADFQPKYD